MSRLTPTITKSEKTNSVALRIHCSNEVQREAVYTVMNILSLQLDALFIKSATLMKEFGEMCLDGEQGEP